MLPSGSVLVAPRQRACPLFDPCVFAGFDLAIECPCAVVFVVAALVDVPVPRTEFAFALPGEFCTCEIALALACVGPCELLRATERTDGPTFPPLACAECAAAETAAP